MLSRLQQGARRDTGVRGAPHTHWEAALGEAGMSVVSHKRFTCTPCLTDKIHERPGVFYFPACEVWSLSWGGVLSNCCQSVAAAAEFLRNWWELNSRQPGMIWSLAHSALAGACAELCPSLNLNHKTVRDKPVCSPAPATPGGEHLSPDWDAASAAWHPGHMLTIPGHWRSEPQYLTHAGFSLWSSGPSVGSQMYCLWVADGQWPGPGLGGGRHGPGPSRAPLADSATQPARTSAIPGHCGH